MKGRCPKCALHGRDKRGDNLYTYPDKGSYCFSCGYYELAPTERRVRETLGQSNWLPPTIHLPRNCGMIPEEYKQWYGQYLPIETIDQYCYYSSEIQRLVFPCKHNQYVARTLYNGPKWLHFGNKTGEIINAHHYSGPSKNNSIVLCEDIISGIKLSFLTRSFVLFGTKLQEKDIVRLKQYDVVNIWLDSDAVSQALKISHTLRFNNIDCKIIYSKLDIKEYNLSYISNLLYS